MKRTTSVAAFHVEGRAASEIRRPSQKRSRERYEAILDATEHLLETLDPAMVSVHRIAAELEMPAASIYHFFPEAPLVFVGLAERYLRGFEEAEHSATVEFDNWQELQTHGFREVRAFFNANTPARKVLLGPAISSDIRTRDLQSDMVMAKRGIEQMSSMFVMPDLPDLLERSIEIIVISDALWALSIYRHDTITEEMEEQARRARIAYARTYLPEYMPRRDRAERGR